MHYLCFVFIFLVFALFFVVWFFFSFSLCLVSIVFFICFVSLFSVLLDFFFLGGGLLLLVLLLFFHKIHVFFFFFFSFFFFFFCGDGFNFEDNLSRIIVKKTWTGKILNMSDTVKNEYAAPLLQTAFWYLKTGAKIIDPYEKLSHYSNMT